jgi:signal transduction histidine kinase
MDSSGGGVGLRGIRERGALLGGILSIEFSERGTTVSAALPRTYGVEEAVADA